MATRPIFIPNYAPANLVKEIEISFEWYPGFAISQKQKSIESLHFEALKKGYGPLLEISTKSPEPLGRSLSAFNLQLTHHSISRHLEVYFQSSKVFEHGGPYLDLLEGTPIDAKRDPRLTNSGQLAKFSFFGEDWGLLPRTAFYDWLYISALAQKADLSEAVVGFYGFSDIEFNPKKSINCQARSAAMFVSLMKQNLLEKALIDKDFFLSLYGQGKPVIEKQLKLL